MLSNSYAVCDFRENCNRIKERVKDNISNIIPASRLQLIEDIKRDIKSGKSILIVGEHGSGKSFVINKLSKNVVRYPTMKRILKQVSKGNTINDMLENAKGQVFVDDIDRIKLNYIFDLSKRVQIIATSTKEINFGFKIYKLKPISKFESYAMARRAGYDKKTAKKIARMSEGNIGHLIKLINCETNRPYFRKINLLPPELLPVIGMGLLVLKYNSYIHSAFELGYLFAMSGYSILIFDRIIKERKKFSG